MSSLSSLREPRTEPLPGSRAPACVRLVITLAEPPHEALRRRVSDHFAVREAGRRVECLIVASLPGRNTLSRSSSQRTR